MMDESRPEKDMPGSTFSVASVFSSVDMGLPVEASPGTGGGSIIPGRDTLLGSVLGVANLDTLNVLGFGVAANMEALCFNLLGEPVSVTLVGDCGRRAGEARSEALKGEMAAGAVGAARDSLNGDCWGIEGPGGALCGDVFKLSLNEDCGGRRAGLASTELLRSWEIDAVVLLTVSEVEKSNFFVGPIALPGGGLTGLFMRGLMGVFSVVASSSSEFDSLAIATCVAFLGLRGDDFSAFSSTFVLARPRVVRAGAAAALRIGLARSPVAFSTTLPLSFTAVGAIFSLSGSSNLTDFFIAAGFATVVALVLVGLFGGSWINAGSSSMSSVFFGRPRVDRVGSGACGTLTTAFLGRPRVDFGAAGVSSIPGWGCAAFLGLPLVVLGSGSIISSGWVWSSSSSRSSARVLRLVVDAVRVSFAFVEAVAILISEVFAAARARVTLFGGDWSFILKDKMYLIKFANDAMRKFYIDACRLPLIIVALAIVLMIEGLLSGSFIYERCLWINKLYHVIC
jgi:hypothetical protein